ncbi:ABC transporter permease [Pseudomonadota bacterium]
MSSDIKQPKQRSYSAQIFGEVARQWTARFGFSWIAIIATIAVFAPFIANSHPLLLSEQGLLDSPALHHLTAGDFALLLIYISVVVAYFIPVPFAKKIWAVVAFGLVSSVIANVVIEPPKVVVYEQYRESVERYDWTFMAPIPYSPKDYLRDYGDTGLEAPLSKEDRAHLFGTDENGADVLSRMIYASRIALGIGLVATGIALFIGIVIGGLMGYFSGIVDMIGMRLVEVFEAIPVIFLLLTFVAFFGRDLYVMMVIIGLTGWTGYARFVRAEFLRLRQQEFVQSAIACGLPLRSVLFRHMLPNGMAPVLVTVSFSVASAILAEATLSFLGLGPVDEPSWGQMLNQAVQAATFNWWMAIFPGGAIFLTMFTYMLIGEAMRDAFDPYLKKGAK